MIRAIDAENSEENYAKVKFGHKTELIDEKSRRKFKLNKIITSMIKCTHRYDHHGEREVMINEVINNQDCPRCDKIES